MSTTTAATRHTARVVLLALLLAAFVAVTPAPAEAAVDSSAEQRLLDTVNAERAARGLDRLRPATDLRRVARQQSATMGSESLLYHTVNLGSKITNWTRLTENVGRGPSAGRIHTALMDSAGHRANILDTRVSEIGIGVEVHGSQMWVTQIFRAPRTDSTVSFSDIRRGGTHGDAVHRIAEQAITLGCQDGRYCPERGVTRQEMASFIARAGAMRPRDGATFRDVSPTSGHAANIEAIRAAGVTHGCGSERYCPDAQVTRGEMASFIARARGLDLGDGRTRFSDVSSGHPHAAAIEAIAASGLTSGCSTGRYCPDAPVSRAEMATFLSRAFGL